MRARGLKTKIAINISIFLILGMLSIDIVTMMTARRDLLRSETAKGKAVSKMLREFLLAHPVWEDTAGSPAARAKLSAAIEESGVACFLLITSDQKQFSFGASRCEPQEEIIGLTRQALAAGSEGVQFIGSTFGLFWMQSEFLVITTPFSLNGAPGGCFSTVFSLTGIYRSLMQTQRMLLLYIVVNTAILAFLGIYRVFKLYLQPLARLASRAENYKEDEEILFAVRKEDNELLRLSSALNGLLKRLSAEKEKLRSTVVSLSLANAELKKAQTEVLRAEKLASVGRLSAGIAHEIGNPIGIVTGYLGLLKQGGIEEAERLDYLDRAEREVGRINAIIRQLLEISRPSPGGTRTVSVHELVADMAQMLNVQPFMSHVRVSLELGAPEDLVTCDPGQLRQVFLNLIINAADAISARGREACGTLVVATDSTAGRGEPGAKGILRIHFSDDGVGIPPEHLADIFDPFFTTKDPGKGTGLGLSVSFMIIESVGGSITVDSAVGRGTTLTVSLPLAPMAMETGQSPAGAGPAAGMHAAACD